MVIVVNRCSRNVKCAGDDDQENWRWNRLGEHLSPVRKKRNRQEEWHVNKEKLLSLSLCLPLTLSLSPAAGSASLCFFNRYREIGERKIVGLDRARQVFWWRRDAQRPSYSRLVHSLLQLRPASAAQPRTLALLCIITWHVGFGSVGARTMHYNCPI